MDLKQWEKIPVKTTYNLFKKTFSNFEKINEEKIEGVINGTETITKIDLCATKIPYKEIIIYLNKKSGKKFGFKSSATKRIIRARFNEGHSLEDFKKVIDTKTQEWNNDLEMNKFIRPITLFGNKFESYLNQSLKIKKSYFNKNVKYFKPEERNDKEKSTKKTMEQVREAVRKILNK